MTKSAVLVGSTATVLILSGCQKAVVNNQQPVKQTVGEVQEFGKAIASGKPAICTTTNAAGETTTYQLKAGKMRVDGMKAGEASGSGSMINDLAYIYTWKTGDTQGFKMAIPKITITPGVTEPANDNVPKVPDFTNDQSVNDYKSLGYKVDCRETNVDDSVFTPPAEVNFLDPAAAMQGIKNKLPTGLEKINQGNLPGNVQEQLKKFQDQSGN